jgi:uncharacterized protein YigE (DUF2233 family)
MKRPTFLIAVWILWCGLVTPRFSWAQALAWEQVAEGLAVTVWEAGAKCGNEVPPLYIVKVDPERFRFSVYYFRDEGLSAPLTIQEWQRRTRSVVLFNAGLFREDFTYLGLLYKDGRLLGGKRHPQWQGLFVAEPVQPGLRKARVLDLSVDSFVDAQPSYREAAQSLMLLDRAGKPRVRQTGKQAHQMIVGEDGEGNILLVKTTAAVTLRALAECLRDGMPMIRHAMAMDGGSSSDLFIGAELLPEQGEGHQPRPWQPLVEGSGMAHIPLPSVIGLFPRGTLPTRQRTAEGQSRPDRP